MPGQAQIGQPSINSREERPLRARRSRSSFSRYWQLYLMMLIPLLYFLLFKYGPMFGAILAFRSYRPGGSPFGAEWKGLYYFKMFMTNPVYWRAFRNTFILSGMNILINFPIPIIFAILLNEVRNAKFKKVVQTISYMPRFISTVVVISMLSQMMMPNSGIINKVLGQWFGMAPIDFISEAKYFRSIYVFTDTWQYTGFTAIIYLAAITGISMELYEAAQIDGANRWQQMTRITLPSIMPTIMVMLIMNIGRILSIGFEKVLLLYRPSNSSTSDIIDTYVYRMAMGGQGAQNYSLSAAAGLFGAVVSVIFVVSANAASRKLTGESIY